MSTTPHSRPTLRLAARLHARGPELTGERIVVGGRDLRVLSVSPGDLGRPLPVTFEQAAAKLASLSRCDCELDGFFVYSGGHDADRWQIEGNLFDRDGCLVQVDLRGFADEPRLDEVLSAFGWPAAQVMFELPEVGVFLGEAEFRRWATQA